MLQVWVSRCRHAMTSTEKRMLLLNSKHNRMLYRQTATYFMSPFYSMGIHRCQSLFRTNKGQGKNKVVRIKQIDLIILSAADEAISESIFLLSTFKDSLVSVQNILSSLISIQPIFSDHFILIIFYQNVLSYAYQTHLMTS